MSEPAVSVRMLGSTRLVGLIGWPVAHSRSPAMQNAAFAALGLDFAYVPLPVRPGRVADAARGLAALGFAGANVTVPHKERLVPFVDTLSPAAQALGTVNTLVVRPDGSLYGDSTDGPGFLADLREHGVEVAGRQALVLGAGGAARAIVHALAAAGAEVAIANRTRERAATLCQAVRSALPGARVAAYPFPEGLAALAGRADLIVNATSLGLHGAADSLPWDPAVPFRRGQVVYDLVYTPQDRGREPTPLLALATAAGAETLDGLGMLVHQGALAFTEWTGLPAPVELMRRAVLGLA